VTFAKARLIVASLLLAAWFAYLGYLALAKEPPVIVPRPQLLAATHIVRATIVMKDRPTLETAHSLRDDAPIALVLVERLDEVKLPGDKNFPPAGEYLVLLEQISPGRYRFAGNPKVPIAFPWNADVVKQVQPYLAK
jgi:hypothetical protein